MLRSSLFPVGNLTRSLERGNARDRGYWQCHMTKNADKSTHTQQAATGIPTNIDPTTVCLRLLRHLGAVVSSCACTTRSLVSARDSLATWAGLGVRCCCSRSAPCSNMPCCSGLFFLAVGAIVYPAVFHSRSMGRMPSQTNGVLSSFQNGCCCYSQQIHHLDRS